MNLKLEREFSKADIIQEVTDLKQQIDAQRPLPPDVEGRVMQKLRLDWNYNSNAIEGNRLSYGETTALLMHGITAKGKPLKDHLDIKGHNEGILYLESMVRDGRPLTEADIRSLHKLILVEPYRNEAQTADGQATSREIQLGQYKTMPNHVQTITGEIHYYATPEETPAKMHDLMNWYNAAINDPEVHPAVVAALFHHKVAAIHPFDDGNGRMARILMNLILMQNGYPPLIIKNEDRANYYSLISQADVGVDEPFVTYIIERLQYSLYLFVKGIKGEEVDEEEDIDKEIALFKVEVKGGIAVKELKSKNKVVYILDTYIKALTTKIFNLSNKFADLFDSTQNTIQVTFSNFRSETFNEFNNNFYEHILSVNHNIDIFSVLLKFNKFKDPLNSFSACMTVEINFDKTMYSIAYGEKQLKKLYHETVTPDEVRDIITTLLQIIKDTIKVSMKKA